MSREELINYLYENNVHADIKIEDLADEISAEPKVGKWIPFKWYFNAHHDSWTDEVKCSECGEMGEDDYNYCPYCGAKMERSE